MLGSARLYAAAFAPHEHLAVSLLPHALETTDGSHDAAHLVRVWKNAMAIHAGEGGDVVLLAASILLHDCVVIEKDSPLRSRASQLAASKASALLRDLGWQEAPIAAVAHAIEAHSFSAGIAPETLEAKIVQDADRLDAIGMVGAARCFYAGGRLGRLLYDPLDPGAADRPYDDDRYCIDHFHTKLLKLASDFQTATGKRLADARQKRLRRFLGEFMEEVAR